MHNSSPAKTGRVQKFEVDNRLITHCQARIISLFIHGLPRKQMAHILGNSRHTIDTHIDRIYKLLNLHDSRQVIVWAISHGFDANGCLNGLYLFDKEVHLPCHSHPITSAVA